MKWIKASERLPEITNGYAKQIVLRWQFEDITPGEKNIQLRVTTTNELVDLAKSPVFDLSRVEWLDESEATELQSQLQALGARNRELEEQVERYQKILATQTLNLK